MKTYNLTFANGKRVTAVSHVETLEELKRQLRETKRWVFVGDSSDQ